MTDDYKSRRWNAPTPKSQKQGYSAEDVARAVNEFTEERGGLIRKLPDQITPRRIILSKYSQFEDVGL